MVVVALVRVRISIEIGRGDETIYNRNYCIRLALRLARSGATLGLRACATVSWGVSGVGKMRRSRSGPRIKRVRSSIIIGWRSVVIRKVD